MKLPSIEVQEVMRSGTKAERKYISSQSFGDFMFFYFPDLIRCALADFHGDFFQDIEDLTSGKLREALWIAFRDSAKTTIAKMFIIWLIVHKKRKYITVTSQDKENAERILFDVVTQLKDNQRLRNDYGSLYEKSRSNDEVKQTKVSNFVSKHSRPLRRRVGVTIMGSALTAVCLTI
jgi:hypothetical protein